MSMLQRTARNSTKVREGVYNTALGCQEFKDGYDGQKRINKPVRGKYSVGDLSGILL
jgi:hypothetical protein